MQTFSLTPPMHRSESFSVTDAPQAIGESSLNCRHVFGESGGRTKTKSLNEAPPATIKASLLTPMKLPVIGVGKGGIEVLVRTA